MNTLTLNQLTLNNLGQWPKIIKNAVILGLSVVSFFFGYWLFLRTHFDELNTKKIQEAFLKKDFESKQHDASNRIAYRNQLNTLEERFGVIQKTFPAQDEMPWLL